ncbi:MAG: uracil-xanthine permease family protein [Desulfonatronovibrionaceae bacterium]
MKSSKITAYSADDKPGWGLSFILGLTHVSLILDGIIFLPNMIGKATQTPADQVAFVTFATLIVAAAGTLFQALRIGKIGCGFILFMGSYSAFLSSTLMAVQMGGLQLLAAMTLFCAPVVILYSYFLRFLRHIVTPPVGGVLIILVALSLMPIAIELWQGGSPDLPHFGSYRNYAAGLVTLTVLVLLMLFGNTTIRLWTPIIGIGAGCSTAFFLGLFSFEHFQSSPWLGLPSGQWPGLSFDLQWSWIPLAGAFFMASLVSAMEGTGNIMLLQQLSLKKFRKVDYSRIQGGLYCDGICKGLSGILGGTPVATFCDNLPLIKMTRTAAARIGIMGAAILICLAFMPKITGFFLDIPHSVIGGVLVVICAMLFYSGLELVMRSGLTFQMGLILGLSLCAGLVAEAGSFFPDIMPVQLSPVLQNGVAMGGFSAIMLSTLLYLFPRPGISFQIIPSQDQAAELLDRVSILKNKLNLDQDTYNRLRLSCEEVFLYLSSSHAHNQKKSLFNIRKKEEGIFVEIISGEEVEEVDQAVRPFNVMVADQEELSRLGLLILSRTATEIQNMHISGFTYISFIIEYQEN